MLALPVDRASCLSSCAALRKQHHCTTAAPVAAAGIAAGLGESSVCTRQHAGLHAGKHPPREAKRPPCAMPAQLWVTCHRCCSRGVLLLLGPQRARPPRLGQLQAQSWQPQRRAGSPRPLRSRRRLRLRCRCRRPPRALMQPPGLSVQACLRFSSERALSLYALAQLGPALRPCIAALPGTTPANSKDFWRATAGCW